jgi:hypothetical protein
VFSVGLDVRSGRDVTVQYHTTDFTAHDGVDYTGASGTLTFAPGVNTLHVTVPVMTDPAYAANEQFFLDLSDPVNALLADGHGVANIVFANAPPAQYILDDGEAGYQQNAGWTNVTNLAAYHLDYDWRAAGNGSGVATWGLANLPAGPYQVYTRWVPFSNRATNAPYTILDGANVRGTVLVNQQLAPVGDRDNDVTWQSLGTFQVTTGTLRVRLSDNANGYVVADAVRIVPQGIPAQVPEIDVSSSGHSIATGDTTPSVDDGTDFGTIAAATSSVTHTWTIANNGNADLHLLGVPRVQISGADAGQFSVVALPDFTVAGGRTTTFQIKFQPTSGGLKQATVLISSDDADESDYSFDLSGNATDPAPLAHNAAEPLDVNGDLVISPRDALIVINALIKPSTAGSESAAPLASTQASTATPSSAAYFMDVDGDGIIAPHDALLVINYLIHHPPGASAAAAATPAATPQVQAFNVNDQAVYQLTTSSPAASPTVSPAAGSSVVASSSVSPPPTVDAVTAAFSSGATDDEDGSLGALVG